MTRSPDDFKTRSNENSKDPKNLRLLSGCFWNKSSEKRGLDDEVIDIKISNERLRFSNSVECSKTKQPATLHVKVRVSRSQEYANAFRLGGTNTFKFSAKLSLIRLTGGSIAALASDPTS